jgi:hypothetical protein
MGRYFEVKIKMDILKIQSDLQEKLLTACREVISRLENDFSEKIYAFVLYPSSGFRDFGLAVSTRESLSEKEGEDDLGFDDELLQSLQEHPDLLAKVQSFTLSSDYYELTASEWAYVSVYPELFHDVNDYIHRHYDQFYEEGMEPSQIYEVFKDVVTSVFKSVKNEGLFNVSCFEADLLKGVQFPDDSNLELVKSISSQVNSDVWHKKVCKNCDEIMQED